MKLFDVLSEHWALIYGLGMYMFGCVEGYRQGRRERKQNKMD